MLDIALICASNDPDSLQRNLLQSDLVNHVSELHVETGAPSAAIAYNRGLAATQAPLVLLAHQDVYLPFNWAQHLQTALRWLNEDDPNWGVLAPFGMVNATHRGQIYSTSLSRVVGEPVKEPLRVESVDELLIILNRNSGIGFDEGLPDWHLYGTDIVQTARARGIGAWVAHMPLVHNDRFHGYLGAGFGRSYRYAGRKWTCGQPIRSPVLWLHPHGRALALYRLRALKSWMARRKRAGDTATDPKILAANCGWETA